MKFEKKMGNNKKKHNSRDSTHRHLYRKTKQARRNKSLIDKDTEQQLTGLNTEQDEEETRVSREGSKIINVGQLQEYAEDITKHSYNAKSDVALIIGKETGKLLHVRVRNNYCHACARPIPQKDHTCYRNWAASEMETDIILEGFLEAESVYRVRYTEFIGDGDSSVYLTPIQNVLD